MTRVEKIERLKLWLFKCVLRSVVALGAYDLIAWAATRQVTELRDKENLPFHAGEGKSGRDTVLVLDWERFRGDLDVFSESKDVRILCMSWPLLRHLLASFVYQPTFQEREALPRGTSARLLFARAEPGSKIAQEREQYRSFLREFLPRFYERLGVDLTMNSDYRFRREHDVIEVGDGLGYPHICYFREAMYIVPAIYQKAIKRYRVMAPFKGSVMAVQNEVTGQIFVDAGMTEPENIMVRGCPRMDGFLQRLQQGEPQRAGKTRQVAFFSWPPHVPLVDGTKFDLFETAAAVVRALAELARDDPEIRVVLKIKDQHMKGEDGGQISMFTDVIREVSGKNGTLPNVVFETKRMAAHDVIMESDVICAMQTTVVLEAAIAGKPVVMPHFDNIRNQTNADQALMYHEYRQYFDTPRNLEEMKSNILDRLRDGKVAPEILEQRRAIFSRFVSPLSADATDRSLNLIRRLAGLGRDNRGGSSNGNKAITAERTTKQKPHVQVLENLARVVGSVSKFFLPSLININLKQISRSWASK